MPTSQYEIPSWGTPTDRLLGWMLEAKQEGEAWLQSQRGARNWQEAVDLMAGPDNGSMLSDQSNTTYPKSKRIAKELVASLSNFRHEGEFKVLWDNSLYDQAHMLTQLDRNWYTSTFANEAHRGCLQYGVVQGTGYLYQEWDSSFWGPDKGDIRLSALAPQDVTFVQLPRDRDIQRAYMVILRFEMPINLAKRMYGRINPRFAADLVPDRDSPGWIQKGLQKVQQFLAPALRVAGRTRQNEGGTYPTVDIFHAYTMDGSINEGLEPIEMGAGRNWAYTVPFVGQALPTGIMNPSTGSQFTRDATPEDALLFPLRRLTIFASTGVAKDDTSPYWHGDVPVTRAWFNDWPWEGLGSSLVTDTSSMASGVSALMRAMEDSAAARLDPPALYDDNMVSLEWAKAFNPRAAGTRAAAPISLGDPIKYPFPPQYYDVPNWIPQFMQMQEDRIDYITGVRDLVAIAKAKQVPGSDTLEKLMEMAGPLVQDMVRALEKPLTQLGTWRAALYFQFYTKARVINTVGPDDGADELLSTRYISDRLKSLLFRKETQSDGSERLISEPSMQFTPELLIPSGRVNTAQERRRMISEFRYEVTESGINEIHRMSNKLFYVQLIKALDFPISPWTMAKIARIPNFGPPPAGTNTEMERWVAWKNMQIDLQIELAKQMQEAQAAMGMAGGAPAGGGAPASGNPVGRPSSFEKAPKIVSKDDGTRSTISTS